MPTSPPPLTAFHHAGPNVNIVNVTYGDQPVPFGSNPGGAWYDIDDNGFVNLHNISVQPTQSEVKEVVLLIAAPGKLLGHMCYTCT